MFKYLVFAVLLAFVAADPNPEPKPGYLAAPLTLPLAYTQQAYPQQAYTQQAYINPYSAYTAPLAYNNHYKYNYAYPYAYNGLYSYY